MRTAIAFQSDTASLRAAENGSRSMTSAHPMFAAIFRAFLI
jgi:hypothetical protein